MFGKFVTFSSTFTDREGNVRGVADVAEQVCDALLEDPGKEAAFIMEVWKLETVGDCTLYDSALTVHADKSTSAMLLTTKKRDRWFDDLIGKLNKIAKKYAK